METCDGTDSTALTHIIFGSVTPGNDCEIGNVKDVRFFYWTIKWNRRNFPGGKKVNILKNFYWKNQEPYQIKKILLKELTFLDRRKRLLYQSMTQFFF